jgi:peroxiredoxin
MKDRVSRLLPYLALAAAAVLVVVLAQQKRTLIGQVEKAQYDLRQARTEPIRGQWFPAFTASTLDGTPTTIGELPSAGKQVLLMYTTTCPYCLNTIPAWKQLTAAVDTMRGVRATVYGVSLDSVGVTQQYVARHQLPYPTLRFPNERMSRIYRAGTVPLTLVLDEQGRAIYSRTGEISSKVVMDSVLAAIRWVPPPPRPDSARAGQAPAERQASR